MTTETRTYTLDLEEVMLLMGGLGAVMQQSPQNAKAAQKLAAKLLCDWPRKDISQATFRLHVEKQAFLTATKVGRRGD